MSYRADRKFAFDIAKYTKETGVDFSDYSLKDLKKRWRETLEKSIDCYNETISKRI